MVQVTNIFDNDDLGVDNTYHHWQALVLTRTTCSAFTGYKPRTTSSYQ